MLNLRPLLIAVALLVVPGSVAADDAAHTSAVVEARALMEKELYHQALPLWEEALKSEAVEPDVYPDAARCAAKRGRYARAIELCRAGYKAARAVEPETDKERTLLKKLKQVEKESKALRTMRDKTLPKIVVDMLKYLPKTDMLKKSKYLDDTKRTAEGTQRLLRREYRQHLLVVILRSEPKWDPYMGITEDYFDEERARARFAALTKLVESHGKRWKKKVKQKTFADSVKFVMRPGPERNRLVKDKLELERIELEWDIRGGSVVGTNNMGWLRLTRPVAEGSKEPQAGSKYTVQLMLFGKWF